jgi:hypothetical protein
MNTSSVQNIERSITKITYIDADCGGVTNIKRVWEEVGGLYRFTHLIGAKPTSPGQTRNNNPKSTAIRNPKPCARDQYQERTRVKTTTSNNATAARTLASPSPCHNRQRNNGQHIYLTRNGQQTAFLRLCHEGSSLRLVKANASVRTPENLGSLCVKNVVERALEDVAKSALNPEVVWMGVLLGGVEKRRHA